MRPAWEFGIEKDSLEEEKTVGGGGSFSPSERDALSGLLNRSGFNTRVRALIDAHPDEAYVLVYGDIDRFKAYNDLFGTSAGDSLLADIGEMIHRNLPTGAVAARLRADHFIGCFPRVLFDPDRMLAVFNEWFGAYREDFTFFVRMGVYPIDDSELDVSLMCDRALLALRAAKGGSVGSRYVLYDETLRVSLLKEQQLAGEMTAALDQGQFVPFFQPQYRYATGLMTGAEVLARWQHPDRGLLGPAEFIPVFERNGLISRFDYYMWDQACRCLRAWIDEWGVDAVPHLSVNLSRADIYRADLCSYLKGLAERYDVPPSLLNLEITESAYMESPDQLIGAVKDLRSAGFTVEMDDFGSGYSSLNTLKDVPVDVLKLDMGFLDTHESTRGGLILASIVRMARWLDLPTIAEGVETSKQAAYLASIGCEYMQGYLFSRPVDRETFERMLAESAHEGLQRPRTENMQDDVAEFWNADSQLALIFNSYVGAAAIAEYDNKTLEIVRANHEFSNLFGMAEDPAMAERLRKNMLAQLLEEDRGPLREALRRAVAGEGDAESELRLRSNGRGRWIRVRVRLLSRAGDLSNLYLLAEETTQEQALRDRLAATRDTIPGGLAFYEVSSGGIRLLDFSDTTAAMIGYTREQYQEHSRFDALAVVHSEDRPIVEAVATELVSGAARSSCVMRVLHRDGSVAWLHLSASTMYRDDVALYAVAVFIDVTHEKKNEKRLRVQSELQHRLNDSVPCGIVRYTVGDDPRVLFINKKGCEIFGYADAEAYRAGMAGGKIIPIHDDDDALHSQTVQALNDGAAPLDFTYRFVRRDGSTGWIEGTSALERDVDGRALIQSAFLDVSERQQKRYEQDIRRYATVLCSVYDEIIEFDGARKTYRSLYSSGRPRTGKTLPLDKAFKFWTDRLPDVEDRARLRAALDECLESDGDSPVVCTYRMEFDGRRCWYQSLLLRVSEHGILCCSKDVTERISVEDRKVTMRVLDTMGKLPVGVGVFTSHDGEVRLRYANDRLRTMFGDELPGAPENLEWDAPLALSDEVRELDEYCNRQGFIEDGGELDVGLRTVRQDGVPIDVRIQGRVMRETDDALALYAVVRDVTDELRDQRERSWQNERYRLLSEMTHKMSFDYDSDSDTVLLYMDRNGSGMEAQVIPHYLETLTTARSEVVHPDSMDDVRQMFENARSGASEVAIEYRADYYGTGYAWYRANLFVAHDDAGSWHLVGLIEDINNEHDLRFRAEYDATTGLSNHAATQDLVAAALADASVRRHSVCVALDIDDFKHVNDTYGHIVGDMLLHEVGGVLRSNFRESDVAGRVGGDEFVLLLKNIDLEVALDKLEQVKRQLAAVKVSSLDSVPSVSMGVYVPEDDDVAYRDVFVKADEALYQAKRSGKNRICVHEK